ncbi:MAG: CoA transferase [Acidobacteria bacterium]|nr:CoA transferase [Acidobacteriota bacterium]MBI3655802.1 CoA transferase [Acidobacteriota bacterium]
MSLHPLPLAGTSVLDLSRLLPGAYCSLLLADLGANVIKIEDLKGGDYLRWIPPLVDEYGIYYHVTNRNKKSVALDLTQPKGKKVFQRLVAGVDVVLEGFRPGVMDRLGLSYEALRVINPRLVYCAISGFGQEGPYRLRAGHDINYISIAGILGATGEADGPPTLPAVQVADFSGSYSAAVGILAALVGRAASGHGRMVDISLTDSALSFMAVHIARNWFERSGFPRGQGMLSGGLACYNVYATQDKKWLALGALEPKFWKAFVTLAGHDDLVDRQFEENQASLRKSVAAIVAAKTQEEWVALGRNHDICCEAVYELDEVERDPHLQAREVFIRVALPGGGQSIQIRCPIRLTETAAAPAQPAPKYGQDTQATLAAHGFSEAEIKELVAEKVVLG